MPSEQRKVVARLAATARWVTKRFGSPSFRELGLPGGELVDRGLADLAAGQVTDESLLVSIAAARLRREGVPVSAALDHPEDRLYDRMVDRHGPLAHARYGALLRQAVSFANCCRGARVDRGRHAS
ncbi:MAG: hypothetical protein AB7I50_02635 [Vicinamibacterales bacterium]